MTRLDFKKQSTEPRNVFPMVRTWTQTFKKGCLIPILPQFFTVELITSTLHSGLMLIGKDNDKPGSNTVKNKYINDLRYSNHMVMD